MLFKKQHTHYTASSNQDILILAARVSGVAEPRTDIFFGSKYSLKSNLRNTCLFDVNVIIL